MSVDVVNLKRVRKKRAAAERERIARENRAKFGQTKSAREAVKASRALEDRRLDGVRRDSDD